MDDVRQADAGSQFNRVGDAGLPFAGRGLGVPTLTEVLDWLPDGIGLVVEIKAREAAEAVVAAVGAHPARLDGRLAVISFDEQAIDRVHELDADLRTGYLLVPTQPVEPALSWAAEAGHVGVHPWEGDLGSDPLPILERARAFGLEVGCYVVNDPERMHFLAACGLWGFVTDVPDVARQALGPRRRPGQDGQDG
jgi:glycerophosphoryl diester phosphodiesterase